MTTLLTDGTLNKLRETQEMNLPETAYIQELTIDNSASGWSESWKTIETQNARIGLPKGETEKAIASTITSGTAYTITLPASVEVTQESRIQINNVNYKVHWTNKRKSKKTATRVVVTEV